MDEFKNAVVEALKAEDFEYDEELCPLRKTGNGCEHLTVIVKLAVVVAVVLWPADVSSKSTKKMPHMMWQI